MRNLKELLGSLTKLIDLNLNGCSLDWVCDVFYVDCSFVGEVVEDWVGRRERDEMREEMREKERKREREKERKREREKEREGIEKERTRRERREKDHYQP
jgi:membrane protein involved in colicin uptake